MTPPEDIPHLRLDQIEDIQRRLIEGDLSDAGMAKEYGPDQQARLISYLFWANLFLLTASAVFIYFRFYVCATAFAAAACIGVIIFSYTIIREISPAFRSPGTYLHTMINHTFMHDFRVISWICRRLTQQECQALSQRLQWEQNSLSHRSQFLGSYFGRLDAILIVAFPIYFLGIPADSFLPPAIKPFIPAGIAIGIIVAKVKLTHAAAMSSLSWAIGITGLAANQHSILLKKMISEEGQEHVR